MGVERSTHKVATFFYCHKLNTFVCTQSLRAGKTSVLGELIAPHVHGNYPPWDFVLSGANGGMMDRSGYIYLIKADTGHYKIGRTKSIPKRLNLFGVKLPFEVTLLKALWVNDMHYFENWLHRFFADERVNGEWFALEDISVDNIVNLEDQADLEDYISFMAHIPLA